MDIRKMQKEQEEFVRSRGWEYFNASQVFTHLIEEIGEIGRHILYEEGYKVKGMGHENEGKKREREFAQALSLFIQLANHFGVDLETAWRNERKIMRKRFPKGEWKKYVGKLKHAARAAGR